MDDKFAARLEEFYKLETFQVAYYKSQISSSPDEYYRKAFEKLVQIESGHVDFFAQLLQKAQLEVPSTEGSLFQLAGGFLGTAAESVGQNNNLKLGIFFEHKAIGAYQKFINESKDKKYSVIRDTLMEYLLDEEFHALWLKDYMNNHPGKTSRNKNGH